MPFPTPLRFFVAGLLLALSAPAQTTGPDSAFPSAPGPLPRAEWGAPQVAVTQAAGVWTIAGRKNTVTFDAADLALHVQSGPATWTMVASGAKDLRVALGSEEFYLRLADAGQTAITPYDTGARTGVKITLSRWRHQGAVVGLTLYLTVALEGPDEEMVCDIAADESDGVRVRQLDWPTALDARNVDYTVLSNLRGVLLPRDYPRVYNPIRDSDPNGNPDTKSEVQSNIVEDWSMSWWGFQRNKSAMMIIVETPNDAAYQFGHPAGGPTVIGPRWRAELGRFGYPRTARFCFFPEGNYVDLAKRYRRYAMDSGLFVSLKEKIARKPVVRELIGTPVMRASILTNYNQNGYRFKHLADPKEGYHLTTFDQRAAALRQLKAQGLDRLTVVLTGWPHFGYDRQHPDALPPAPAAGGWEGMKRLADTCRELGYLFTLHDQYRDYYVDAPSYNPQFAIHEEDAVSPAQAFPGSRFGDFKEGSIPFMDHWDGGKMSYLNPRFMLEHLKQNYAALFAHGIHPQGTYLDVFGYVPPDEDFNPEHPTTRTDGLRARIACYNWARNNLGVVGTEAGCDWTVPYVDYTSPLEQKEGIVVPLYNLVYHDAIMVMYSANDLHGFLNAGLPAIGGRGSNPINSAAVKRMAALHRRLALVEMTNHEFLDPNYRKERTTFADGTTVTVDWDAKTVQIAPDLP